MISSGVGPMRWWSGLKSTLASASNLPTLRPWSQIFCAAATLLALGLTPLDSGIERQVDNFGDQGEKRGVAFRKWLAVYLKIANRTIKRCCVQALTDEAPRAGLLGSRCEDGVLPFGDVR